MPNAITSQARAMTIIERDGLGMTSDMRADYPTKKIIRQELSGSILVPGLGGRSLRRNRLQLFPVKHRYIPHPHDQFAGGFFSHLGRERFLLLLEVHKFNFD